MSPKFVTDFNGGSMRILFAADSAAGYCATKAYHSIKGAGVRYIVSLYRLKDGELLALLDGRHITDLRTGAASGVIARKVAMTGPVTVGLIGSGHQAATQLEALAAVYPVGSAAVYSPTAANREAFARRMSARLGFPVTAVDSAQAAAKGHPVVAAASSARGAEPVLRGEWLADCRLLLAVGNTRAQFAEVDVRCFQDARLVVVDSVHALEEAGELRQAIAAGALPESKRATLGKIVTGAVSVPAAGLVVFKSVGTALQDLALAARYYELIGASAGVPTATDLASVK
jgi:ornithine cyclodeaminase/alanine dehydrogenase-like protein (mu-crystallin family)